MTAFIVVQCSCGTSFSVARAGLKLNSVVKCPSRMYEKCENEFDGSFLIQHEKDGLLNLNELLQLAEKNIGEIS